MNTPKWDLFDGMKKENYFLHVFISKKNSIYCALLKTLSTCLFVHLGTWALDYQLKEST